jgi:DNA polymerase
MKAFVDFETRSTVELKRTGVYPYASHSDTDVWCMAYAFENEPPRLWQMGDPFPEDLLEATELWAHNASFERVMWRDCMVVKYGWPEIPMERWYCTAAEAARMALPRSLEQVCYALKLPIKKDMEGHRLMLRMCRPRRFDAATGEPVWWDVPEKVARLGQYCMSDVSAEQAVFAQLNRLSPAERETYLLTETMNDRGIQIDYQLVTAARGVAEKEITLQNRLLHEATSGKVSEVTKVEKLKEWLREQGLETESLNKKALQEILDDGQELSPEVSAALDARREAGKSSVKKLDALLETSSGGRTRGLLLYHGASTGRWSGRGPQIQNFPRGGDVLSPEAYISQVLAGKRTSLNTLSAMLRSCLVSAPGHQFYCADFAAIEARVVAWCAGEHVMLQQFREGRKLYIEMAEIIFNKKVSKEEDVEEYTTGKSSILGCGFGMGWKKFVKQFNATKDIAQKAVKAYRETYPRIVDLWKAVNDAAILAVQHPGQTYRAGLVRYTKSGSYLLCGLPSKRVLFYPSPQIVDRPMPWDPSDLRPSVEFSGINQFTRQWERLTTYGGSLTENFVQAIARDLLRDAMLRVERHGYPVVGSIHDEVLSEAMTGDLNEFMSLMKVVPEWATGLPIDASGWVGDRWRK